MSGQKPVGYLGMLRTHTTLGFFIIPNVPEAMGQEELGVSMGVQSNTEPH